MRPLIIIFCFILLTPLSPGLSQNKRPKWSPAKPPPVSTQTATTKDGRTVLLRSDGTWEYSADPVASPTPIASPESPVSPMPSPVPSPTSELPIVTDLVGNWSLKIQSANGPGNPATLRITSGEAGIHVGVLDLGTPQPSGPNRVTMSNGTFKVAFTTYSEGRFIELAFDGRFNKTNIEGSMALTAGGQVTAGTFVGTPENPAAYQSTNGSLAIQAGIVYKVGGPQPVARTDFVILDGDPIAIIEGAGIQGKKPALAPRMGILESLLFMQMGNPWYDGARAVQLLASHVIAKGTTDFNGNLVFTNLPAGRRVYIFGIAQTRGGWAVWDLWYEIPPGQTWSAVLDQKNAAIVY
jgi:hypothetical protein